MIDRWLPIAAVIGALYVASLAVHPYPGSWALKALPALLLAGLALTRLSATRRRILSVAFVAAAAGDALLDVDGTANLAPGLGCFLVMQIGFAIDFARQARGAPARWPLVALLVAAGVGLLIVAWPRLGDLAVPVVVYVAALVTMTWTALRVRERPWIGRGALLFVASDALIGVSQFVMPFPAPTAIIVALYYAAMLMIGRGLFGPPKDAP